MLPGRSRARLHETLSVAYAAGLLSEDTFTDRLQALMGGGIVDPGQIAGDIVLRPGRSERRRGRLRRVRRRTQAAFRLTEAPAALLGLDWSGATTDLLIGRDALCDVVIDDIQVSRRHARLHHREGHWVLQDLGSKNGTRVNGAVVGRCVLHPGDELALGGRRLLVD